jgi:hypothetical protein
VTRFDRVRPGDAGDGRVRAASSEVRASDALRVVFLSRSTSYGGAEIQTLREAVALRRLGTDVALWGRRGSILVREARRRAVPVRELVPAPFGWPAVPRADRGAIRSIGRSRGASSSSPRRASCATA